jgi:CheY-like chemotaxis protein
MTILLIDDDEEDHEIFREAAAIAIHDVKFLTARDGEEGLSLLQQQSLLPDYIFLDVNMPKMDGKEFLRRIRADLTYSHIPVIVYSTNKHRNDQGEYFKLGASNYITKPSEFNLLVTYLKSVLLRQ